jgi:hypothetical protein
MRKTVAAATAVLTLGLAALAYAQAVENTYDVTGSTSPTRAGTKSKPVPVGVKFGYEVDTTTGARPSPVKRYSIRFAGLRANTNAFPTCSVAKMEEEQSVDGCPAKSIVGTGFIRNATGITIDPNDRSVECNAALWVVNSGKNKGAIFVKGTPDSTNPKTRCAIELAAPIPARFINRANEGRLEFDVPPSLLHPATTLDNAVVEVTSSIKNVKSKGRGFFESTGGCVRGKRKISVVFTPETGSAKAASTQANCKK